ncbi:hypothetical protein DPPLL_37230 [Desulfofustis limnaeus]|uniref:Uncharacterized protein n=1 Tax=Desulfofustis limnaeus TaxID=2740163 RepID=A0ABN6M912_9BACT|nr:hypothetical protein DPPLL_37230 [Desulfofustis limnaeus]
MPGFYAELFAFDAIGWTHGFNHCPLYFDQDGNDVLKGSLCDPDSDSQRDRLS